MSEPISNSTATLVTTSVTIADVLSLADANVLIAALAGAVIFVLSAIEFTLFKRIMLFAVSFFTGIVTAGFVSEMLATIVPTQIEVKAPIGALLASTISVRFLMSINNNLTFFINRFDKRGGEDVK